MNKMLHNKKGMGWISKLAIGVVLFGIIFSIFTTFFYEMEANYGSNYNDTGIINVTKQKANLETQTSFNQTNSSMASLIGSQTQSSNAFDNIMSIGWGIVQKVFNPIGQSINIIKYLLGIIGIPEAGYDWLYYGIFTILTMLLIFAVLGVIFRAQF